MGRNNPTQDEKDAKKICCKYLGFDEISLRIEDMPDLQDDINNVGIEVRNVTDKNDGKNNAFVQINFNSQKSIVEKNNALEKMHIDGKILNLGLAHIFVDNRFNDLISFYNHRIIEFINAYEDKINKLNGGNYQIFENNDLFLFCDSFNKWEISKALEKISKNLKNGNYDQFETKFRYIYAYAFEMIYKIDKDFNIIDQIDHTK